MSSTSSKYHRTIKGASIDVYDVLTAFGVANPATAHAVKKLLMPGQRGAKNTLQDLAEAKASVERAIQIEGETQAWLESRERKAVNTQGEEKAQVSVYPNRLALTAVVPSAEGDL